MRQIRLDSRHYASSWKPPAPEGFYDVSEVNIMGHAYSLLPNGPEKEAKLFDLIKNFHTYLSKYLNMIMRGHIASYAGRLNTDSVAFLKYMIGKNTPINRKSLLEAAKFLHIAFKQQDANDIYDILVTCLLRAIHKYDPHYTDKLRNLIGVISAIEPNKPILVSELEGKLDFDCTSFLRLLVSHGFLSTQKVNKKVFGYKRLDTWPPPADKFGVDRIGFTYFVQKWFRYYLQAHIERATEELESKGKGDPEVEGYALMQLEHRSDLTSEYNDYSVDMLPHKHGNMNDGKGTSWAVDDELINSSCDISELNLDWVNSTNDPLFKDLHKVERLILFRWAKGTPWSEIASSIQMSEKDVHDHFDKVIALLRSKTELPSIVSSKRIRKKNKPLPIMKALGIQSAAQAF